MRRLLLLINTIRYLKAKQLFYQLYYRFFKRSLNLADEPVIRGRLSAWPEISYQESSTSDGITYDFLGESARLEGDWNSPSYSKLWLYNLHYQDALNSKGAGERNELNCALVNEWISGNPPMTGNGWEPYCLSLRIVNWVKFFSRLDEANLKSEWLRSLALQAHALENQLEYHILANHLFANAKALVFAGTFLSGANGERWLQKGLQLLENEVHEQFLSDGAHYERSPMYQGILLWDLADLLMLVKQSGLEPLKRYAPLWEQKLSQGIYWLRALSHPDGEISFFNDATFDIAPTLDVLEAYARRLDIRLPHAKIIEDLEGRLLLPSGFGVVDWPGQHRLLVDVAPVGPDYQPGHAHADTLSCELSLFGQRLLVNSGISQYGEDAERHRQRSTPAHNTVAVDGENSSEVWAGFRVARRAKPFAIDLNQDNGEVRLTACHDGYRRLPGKVTHCRKWHTQSHQLSIEDQLDGRFKLAVAYWHFHPDIRVRQINDFHFVAEMSQGQSVDIHIEGGVAVLRDGVWHPGFGKSVPNTHLEIRFKESRVLTLFKWKTA